MFIHRLSVDDSREEKEEEEEEELCVPCNSATHLFPLLGVGVLYKACSFGGII